jgi:hypothetical protein
MGQTNRRAPSSFSLIATAVRRGYPVAPQSVCGRRPGGRMLTPMSDSNATRATLAAREAAARTALGRLRDCSRDVERLAADARAAGRDSLAEHLRPRVRAFTIEAARIRVELRRWDVGSSLWIALLQARLDRLAAEIGLLAEVT